MKTKKPVTIIKLPIFISLSVLISAILSGYIVIHKQYWKVYSQSEYNQVVINSLASELQQTKTRLTSLESEDQRIKNNRLEQDLKETKQLFASSLEVYELLNDAVVETKSRSNLERQYAAVLKQLRDMQYASASSAIKKLKQDINTAVAAYKPKGVDISSLTAATAPPGSGYARQKVTIDSGDYAVDIAVGDLNSTKVIVDTASNETCHDNCPVLTLSDYVSRNGAWAAVNGSYFCPSTYPTCVGKTNSFDLLVMNKNKTYFNSDNNVYSNNPAVIFMGSSVRFVRHASEWGRDTGIDSMLSNFPLLLMDKNIQFGGNDDSKMGSLSNRSFVANKGSVVYIGVVHKANVVQAAKVLQTLGLENAINLDSGGSTAFWVNGGYKVGPGRAIPNAILFLRK